MVLWAVHVDYLVVSMQSGGVLFRLRLLFIKPAFRHKLLNDLLVVLSDRLWDRRRWQQMLLQLVPLPFQCSNGFALNCYLHYFN